MRMGTIMITTITPPMMTMPSVEPISDSPVSCGKGVVCAKNAPEETLPCAGTELGKVRAALSAARVRLSKMAIVERTSLLIAVASISR